MKYEVEITETLLRVAEVEAASAEDAEWQICAAYRAGDIVLDAEDCTGVEVAVKGRNLAVRLGGRLKVGWHGVRRLWYNVRQRKVSTMPSVLEYDEVKTSFSRVFDFVESPSGCAITIVRKGRPVARLSPIRVYRTTEADPELGGEIKCDLFADESSDWENA